MQVISDIHLEFRGNTFQRIIKATAPILILAGDICAIGNSSDFETYRKFIQYVSGKYKYVIHVAGNHEYYTSGNRNIGLNDTIPGINNILKKYTKQFNNVFFLNNETLRLDIDGEKCVFIGTVLWTHVDDDKKKFIQSSMNDYSHIYMPNKAYRTDKSANPVIKFNIDDMKSYHQKAIRFIKKETKLIKRGEKCILITHHKPIKDSQEYDLIQAYESDLANIIIKKPIDIAIHGHTHKHYDKIINGVRVYSNPKGYINQHTKYDPSICINV